MNQLLSYIKKKSDNLSPLEKEVVNFIIDNPDTIANITMKQFSNMTFVSNATISRTIKHLGFKNYQEFKLKLQDSIIKSSQNKHTLKDDFPDHLMDLIAKTFNNPSTQYIDSFINIIETANRIEIFGVGGSTPIAQDLARKYMFLKKQAFARTDWDELEYISENLTEKDLAIFVSLSGETKQLIQYANNLKNRNVPILSLIGRENSTLASYSKYSMISYSTIHYYHSVDISSRAPMSALIDYLIHRHIKTLHT